ncbi:hypothetical protein ATK36_2450 [Amycolatopsis sulphurea]|uniref:Uncharacterized protein n=1 Tax=Amycolatopsis sulphurea TaxID=76022 RepID=A0A2A9F8B8_9PSEU|nr:hypothetical protein [Amycolatopsis sulphurea]PFG47408.1 hypothetical protein ATK36_2450 [Amycolatopsis sulphurea]
MEAVFWLLGMAVLAVLTGVAIRSFQGRVDRLDRRFRASEQADRWRFLQGRWQQVPKARLATVSQVHELTRTGGCLIRIEWTDRHEVQDVEIVHDQVEPGDFLLLRGIRPGGVVTREELLARAGADAPDEAEHRR